MDLTLSIIIPVYNVEQYIERCLHSVVDFCGDYCNGICEIIVVDDGSTDNSFQLIHSVVDKHPSIRVIRQQNQGLSAARNRGLDIALGKYVFFVDSDDFLEIGSITELLKIMDTVNPDIILFDIVMSSGKKIKFHLPSPSKKLRVDNYMTNHTLLSAAWQGIFKKKMFDDYELRMPVGKLAEDDDLIIKLFSQANTLFYFPRTVYHYCLRENSISNDKNSSHTKKLIHDRLEIFRESASYIQQFKGERYVGLKRKMDYLALDILRLLIRKRLNREDILLVTHELAKLDYYPLPSEKYSVRYRFFGLLLSSSRRLQRLSSNSFFSRFF